MKAAIYVRTSTADQDGRAQLHQLRAAARARGAKKPLELVDVGHSGATTKRPALAELRRRAFAGELQLVMVTALDRLGRSVLDLVQLVDELAGAGVAVVSLREGFEFSTSTGRLLLQLFGAVAEFERAIIRDRINAGLQRAREKGTRSGKPIGRPARAVDLQKVWKLRAAGESWRRIARRLKVPRRTLERAAAASTKRRKTTPARQGLASL